jgi:hypothetical protein
MSKSQCRSSVIRGQCGSRGSNRYEGYNRREELDTCEGYNRYKKPNKCKDFNKYDEPNRCKDFNRYEEPNKCKDFNKYDEPAMCKESIKKYNKHDICEFTLDKEKMKLEQDKITLKQEKLRFEKYVAEYSENICESTINKDKNELEQDKIILKEEKLKFEKYIADFNEKFINIEGRDDCCICMNGPRDTVLVPCGHKMFCYNCVKEQCEVKKGNCPICKSNVATFVKVYG